MIIYEGTNYYKSANIASMHDVTDKKTVQTEIISDVFKDILRCKGQTKHGRVNCSSLCPAMLWATWSTTVNLSLTLVSDNCVLLTLERSLSTGRPAVSETGPSQLLEPECGTVCRQT